MRAHVTPNVRSKQMAKRYAEGATLEEIRREFDLTRESVRQIICGAGYSMSDLRKKGARARKQRILTQHGEAIRALLGDGRLPSEVASGLQVPVALVREVDAADPGYARQRKIARRKSSSLKYSDEEVLQCLRDANEALGGVLTTAEYTALSRVRCFPDGRPWPTHQTAVLRFGSWRAALTAAGLAANPSTPIAGKRLFEDVHCIDAILEVDRVLGHLPTVQEYEHYASQMGGALPSSATVRNRLGRWHDVLRRAAEFSNSIR